MAEIVNEEVKEVEVTEDDQETVVVDGLPTDYDISEMDDLSDDHGFTEETALEEVAEKFEDGMTDEIMEDAPSSDEPPATKNPAPKVAKTARSKKAKAISHENIGSETDTSIKSINEYISPAEREERAWVELKNLAKAKGIVWGRLSGVQMGIGGKLINSLFAVVTLPKYPNMQVYIHEKDFWMETQNFGNSYAGLNDQQKEFRRMNTLSYQLNARIPFFIKSVTRTKMKGDQYQVMQTPYSYTIVGDRVSAMHYMQKYWFFDKTTETPRVNYEDTYSANVLLVRPETVKVECCGVETYISAYELSGKTYVENCRDFCKCGDKIAVRVQKLHLHAKGEEKYIGRNGGNGGKYENDTVYLSVSGRLFDNGYVPKNLPTMSLNGVYYGHVRSYNAKTGVYSINLTNGVVASVHAGRVSGGNRLDIGDSVFFYLEEKLDTYVRGRCTKI